MQNLGNKSTTTLNFGIIPLGLQITYFKSFYSNPFYLLIQEAQKSPTWTSGTGTGTRTTWTTGTGTGTVTSGDRFCTQSTDGDSTDSHPRSF